LHLVRERSHGGLRLRCSRESLFGFVCEEREFDRSSGEKGVFGFRDERPDGGEVDTCLELTGIDLGVSGAFRSHSSVPDQLTLFNLV